MKIGLVITIYNRPEYLEKTLDSLKRSKLPNVEGIFMVNDCSTDIATNKLFSEFNLPNVKIIHKIMNVKNESMFYGLRLGFDHFYNENYDILCNLDSDAIVKPYWISILLQLHKLFPENIVTGFNTPTHPICETFPKYHTKKAAGGINYFFGRSLYQSFRNLFQKHWDWKVIDYMKSQNKYFIVSNPSVVQHIGIIGLHTPQLNLKADVALDFF